MTPAAAAPPHSATKRKSTDAAAEEDVQSKFEAELDATQRQQLGKKRKRVGVKTRRKRLDPALQVSLQKRVIYKLWISSIGDQITCKHCNALQKMDINSKISTYI